MKKYIYTVLILTAFLLQGCGKEESFPGTGRGEILYNGYTYQLYNAHKVTGLLNGFVPHHTYYYHALSFSGRGQRHTIATIEIRSKSNRVESGEFHVNLWTVDEQIVFRSNDIMDFPPAENRPVRISKRINLSDDFVHFTSHFSPSSKRMKLIITEERGVFDIELRSVECEGDFFIRYRGLVTVREW